MDFTSEDYPLRYALNNEDILSSLRLKAKNTVFFTFLDFSLHGITVFWKELVQKIIKKGLK
tara:strand:+ start:469 stop:651 length:183 start_codon:yes stop_codon:yes gene_type:complete